MLKCRIVWPCVIAESLRVELECRREEDEIEVNIDLQKASQKSMAKIVNQVCAHCQH